MSFEKIIHKLRDAWRQDIRQSLGGLPGYYWGEVTAAGEVLLDAVAPGAAPVPVDDLIGAAVGDRVLLVHVDGAFSVVGVAGRPRVGATGDPRQVYVTDADGLQDTVLYHSGLQADAIVQRSNLDVLVPTTPAYANSATSRRHVELNGVPRFATTAARDTAFPVPVDGQICYVAGNGYYVRENGAWRQAFGDTGWVGSVLSDASGFTNTVTARLRDGRVSLRGTVSGTFTANTTTTVGTITDTRFRPDALWGGATTTSAGFSAPYLSITSAGVVTVRTSTSGSENVYMSPATYFA